MIKILKLVSLILITFGFFSCQQQQQVIEVPVVTDSILVDHVWASHPVGFDLLTEPPHQFIAYYDSNRVMTVAQRELGEKNWKKVRLDEVTGWDSHNYISLALDNKGYLHVSGNMHVDTLVYFQSTKPYDIQSLERRKGLIGKDEVRVTYPKFFETPEGDLIFTYRIGGSGNGNQIYNRYNPETQTWSRLQDEPLVDGQGEMNAYLHGPVLGPDGFFHLVWVWRDTPDAETNHDLSYAKSKDLVNWYKSDGSPQQLPITLSNCEIVDPVPVKQGMINGNTVIGFDSEDRCIITYHKFDEAGNTQIYQARQEEGGWQIYQSTDYDFRWDFGGRGSLNSRIRFGKIGVKDGQLSQNVWIDTVGFQRYILNPETMKVVEKKYLDDEYPLYLDEPVNQGQQVNRVLNQDGETLYLLRWETLPRNRDRPREGPLPPANPLVLYEVK